MNALSHDQLIKLANALGYNISSGGLCKGFSGMLAQAILSKDEKSFYNRLAFISKKWVDITHDFKEKMDIENELVTINKLADEIIDARNKVKNKENISDDEKKLLEIPVLFEGIVLYLNPSEYGEFFDPKSPPIDQQDMQAIYPLVKPKALQDTHVELLRKRHIFSKDDLKTYLHDLTAKLDKSDKEFPVLLGASKHSICLKYDKNEKNWIFVDTNKFKHDNSYYQRVDTKELADNIFNSFTSSSTEENLIIRTEILTLDPADFKKEFDDLDSKHPIQSKQAMMYEKDGSGLLHSACLDGEIKTVTELLAQKEIDINKSNTDKKTPLYFACELGRNEIVRELLRKDSIEVNKESSDGYTPLLIACNEGQTEIVKELLRKDSIEVNKESTEGYTPLVLACAGGNTQIVKELLNHKHININVKASNGVTALYMACLSGQTEIVDLLLKKNAEIDAEAPEKHTPLQAACLSVEANTDPELFKILLENHADICHKNQNEETAFDIAMKHQNLTALGVLLTHMKDNKLNPDQLMSADSLKDVTEKQWVQSNLPDVYNYLKDLEIQKSKNITNQFKSTISNTSNTIEDLPQRRKTL